MESWQVCGVGILCALFAVIIKQIRADAAVGVRLAGSVILLGAVLALVFPIAGYLGEVFSSSAMAEYAEILFKALGIAFVTHIGAGICRDCGEVGIASYVELAGKCEILLLSLPVLSSLLSMAEELIGWQS